MKRKDNLLSEMFNKKVSDSQIDDLIDENSPTEDVAIDKVIPKETVPQYKLKDVAEFTNQLPVNDPTTFTSKLTEGIHGLVTNVVYTFGKDTIENIEGSLPVLKEYNITLDKSAYELLSLLKSTHEEYRKLNLGFPQNRKEAERFVELFGYRTSFIKSVTDAVANKYNIKPPKVGFITNDITISKQTEDDNSTANMLRSQALIPDYQSGKRTIDTLVAEIEKAQKMLPKNEIKVVAGFIKGNAPDIVGQVRGFGKTLVSSLGPSGVVYHETFHQVSLYVLSSPAQQRMYDEVRQYEGKVRTYSGEVKKFSALTDKEAEEYLAEEFREWILSDGDYKKDLYSVKKGFFAKVFQKIRTIIRSLLGLDTKFEIDPNMAAIPQVFQAIESGKFANHEANLDKDLDLVRPFEKDIDASDTRPSLFKGKDSEFKGQCLIWFPSALKR